MRRLSTRMLLTANGALLVFSRWPVLRLQTKRRRRSRFVASMYPPMRSTAKSAVYCQ